MRKGSKDAFTSRRYRELMQNTSFECYRQTDTNPSEDVAISAHHHAFYEIIFVMSGDFFYEVEGRPYHLSRGDVILIDELQFHHGQIYHSQGYERYALWIHPQYMQRLARRFPKLDPQYCFLQLNSENNNLIHLDDASFSELKSDLSHLFDSFWSKTPSDEVLSESYFAIILTRLNQIVHRQHSDEEIPTISSSDQAPTNLFTTNSFNLQGLDAITDYYDRLAHGTAQLTTEQTANTMAAPSGSLSSATVPTANRPTASWTSVSGPAAGGALMPQAPSGSLAALSPTYGTHPTQVIKQALMDSLEQGKLPPQSTWRNNTGPFMKVLDSAQAGSYQPDHGLSAPPLGASYGTISLTPATLGPLFAAPHTSGLNPGLLNFGFELSPNATVGPYVGSALGFKLNEASLNPFIISIASPQLAVFSTWINADVQEVQRPHPEQILYYSEAQRAIARNATLAALQQLDAIKTRPEVTSNATVQLGSTLLAQNGTAQLSAGGSQAAPLSLSENSARIIYQGLGHWTFKTYDGVSCKQAVQDHNMPLRPEHMPLTLNFAGSRYQIMELSLDFENDLGQGDGVSPAPITPVEQNSEDDRELDLSRSTDPRARPSAALNVSSAASSAPSPQDELTPQRFSNLTAELAAQATALGAQDDDEMHLNLKLSESLKLSAILKYINQHINENLSLDELAQRFSLSKFYLTRRFKELTGLSLHQFIVKKRLTRARYLISVGIDPYRAAVDAGFNNYSHFSRTFKSYFGQNPSSIPKAHTIHVTADRS